MVYLKIYAEVYLNMKFTCEKAVLLSAVTAASRTVTSRSSIPALEGILIEVSRTTVALTGYNLATGIRSVIRVEDAQEGSIIINARLFGDIVRKSPDDWITVQADENLGIKIKCGMSEFSLIGLAAEDFPTLPEADGETSLRIERNRLRSMLSMTGFAVSDNEAKPVHTGELFECEDGVLTVVAVDGFRLAVRREEVTASNEKFSFIVPGAALREVERLCGDTDETVNVNVGRRHICFDFGDAVLISRLLEGEFLNYRAAIPGESKYSVTVSAQELRDSVERVSLIISERLKNPIRCEFGDGTLRLWCQTTLGRAADEIACNGDGGGTEIGFNNRFLQDAVRAVPDERVVLKISGGLNPCVLAPEEGNSYLFMVLPVRLK